METPEFPVFVCVWDECIYQGEGSNGKSTAFPNVIHEG